jgi:RNA polymerase subunit RPABC4/transcription elongation factor Spt4
MERRICHVCEVVMAEIQEICRLCDLRRDEPNPRLAVQRVIAERDAAVAAIAQAEERGARWAINRGELELFGDHPASCPVYAGDGDCSCDLPARICAAERKKKVK